MPVIVEGSQTTEKALAMNKSLEKGHNRPMQEGAWVPRPTEFKVYLFTISKRAFRAAHALIPAIEIPACEANERYKKFRFIPHPFAQKVEDVFNTGREPYDYHSAERIAQDICDPSNPTLNQDIDNYGRIDPYFAVQAGTNLSRYGIFWSRNEEPTEQELQAFEKKRDNFFRFIIRSMDKFYAEDPKNAERLMGNAGFDMQDVRMALDHFGEERPFHKKFTPMQSCPNCAAQVPQGVAYHRDQDGDLCVIDWKKTVASGKRKKEDVPEDKRWWKSA